MAVVLRGEELVLRGERTIDFPDIESSPFRGRCRIEIRRQVGEGHDGLAFRGRRNGPIRLQAEQARRGQSAFQRVSTGRVVRHTSPPGHDQVSSGNSISWGAGSPVPNGPAVWLWR